MNLDLKKIKYDKFGYFRFKKIEDFFILTNDEGNFVFLSPEDFELFLQGKLGGKSLHYKMLCDNNFIKDQGNINVDLAINEYRERKGFLLNGGPSLHIIVVTLRCNQKCIYCHASAQSMDKKNLDMDKKTANKVLDLIFSTSNNFIAIEFQGGEPLVSWPVVKYIIESARKRNQRINKKLEIRLISNFSLMDKVRYDFLIKNKVGLCTSLDGPRELHDRNRPAADNRHEKIAKWIKKFNADYPKIRKKGYIWKMSSVTTISRYSLPSYKEIIDEYVNLGFSNIFLRPLDPFGFSSTSWNKIGYGIDEYIEFYLKALEYVLELNLAGKNFEEKFAKFFIIKILTNFDPNMFELRSPCGAGIGQLAYNYNGDIYTCDEGRMVSMMDDENFRLGNVYKNNYEEIVTAPVIKTVCSASCLEGLPGCKDCVYLPYCGTCPIINYYEQKNIIGQMPTNSRCRLNKAVLDYLFVKIKIGDYNKVFEKWLKNNEYEITSPYCF